VPASLRSDLFTSRRNGPFTSPVYAHLAATTCLSDVDMAFRMHYASYGLIGYTMKIVRGAARIARSHPRRQITLRTLSQSFAEHVWSDRLGIPNPFVQNFDPDKAPPLKLPSARTRTPLTPGNHPHAHLELHA
jgi:hypothetical protein